MILRVFIFYLVILVKCSIVSSRITQPTISNNDGHVTITASYNKNITLNTQGRGKVHVNGLDLSKVAEISTHLSEIINRGETTIESYFEKVSKIIHLHEQSLVPNTTNFPVIQPATTLSVRRLNRRINLLSTKVNTISVLLNIDECLSSPCQNGGTCQDLFNGFLCNCPPEWEGSTCAVDVNECTHFSGTDLGCQNGATCINRPGSYECVCTHGWFGLHCTRRNSDCNSGSSLELCGHGTCISQNNNVGYTCLCEQGWTTDGRSPACNTDVNECTSNKPPCSVNPLVQCINLPGTFHCASCPPGYTGNGYYCVDIDECAMFNGGCSVNPMVQCVNTLGSRICHNCPPGYSGNGIVCTYQGTCNVNNGGCHPSATCTDNPRIGSSFVECTCPAGFIGNGIGPNGCTASGNGDLCSPNPCIHGTCIANSSGSYTCQCNRLYQGRNCNKFVDFCSTNPNYCQNGGTCVSMLGRIMRCICTSSYTGQRCEDEKQACGGRLQAENGTLVHPSGSAPTYNHQSSCAWTIETNLTKVIHIKFKRFNLEKSTDCQFDWLQIHDGKNTLTPSVGRFCGSDLPKNGSIISTDNIIYLWFRSDHTVAKDGFELTWNTEDPNCGSGEFITNSYGTIQSPGSPGNYPNNRDCHWRLIAPAGKRFLFHFFALNIGDNSNCDRDYLEFISDEETSDHRFARFCNSSLPSPLYSLGSDVIVHFHSDEERTYSGFQISYSIVDGIPHCGGVFTAPEGEIRSPTYQETAVSNLNCEYKIHIVPNSKIRVTFLQFSMEQGYDGCDEDSLSVHAGPTSNSPLIGRYCGTQLPPSFTSPSNEVFLVFRTSTSTHSRGFVMNYKTLCEHTLTEPTGVIELPYAGIMTDYQCNYLIAQPLGTIINFEIIEYEPAVEDDCGSTIITVRDGDHENSTLLGQFCGVTPPIVSSSNYLYLQIEMEHELEDLSFHANYSVVDVGCGGTLKEMTGSFSTPNTNGRYNPSSTCRWVLSAPPGYIVQVTWITFHLESTYSCSYDYVELYDNNTESGKGYKIGRYCGHKVPPILLSTSNLVTVTFKSDHSIHLEGFTASYNFIHAHHVCGGNYFTSVGVFKSPNYPNMYPDNNECIWTITAEPGHQIMLNIEDFKLESGSNCRYDYLEIHNGASGLAPLIGRFCGNEIPKNIPSHTNKLYLKFKSDMTKTNTGFKIRWDATSTGCGGTLTGSSGSIISPQYPEPYSTNTECIWRITVSLGSSIQLIFSDLDLEMNSRCTLDYVEILDGAQLNSNSLGRFCAPHTIPITSSSNKILVKFRSDISQEGRGFHLIYNTMCNNTLTGLRGIIESPNFPNGYPENLNCRWEIIVPAKNKVNISFSHFALETNNVGSISQCVFDFLEVDYHKTVEAYDEPEVKKHGIYCGTDIPELMTIDSSHVFVHLQTDNSIQGAGFRLEWQLEGCGDIFKRPDGVITSPNYPNHYQSGVECEWSIEVEFGYSIEITFHVLDIEKDSACSYDYINLYNGEDATYPLLATLCHQNKPTTVSSTGNFMFLKFFADPSYEGIGFTANYTTRKTRCGGEYTSNGGSIMSPNYPKLFDRNDTCGYLITVDDGHVVNLSFEDFDFAKTANLECSNYNTSYVKVYDGPSAAYPVLNKICGRDKPNGTISSTYNHMYVEMVTDNRPSKGFLAKYYKSCGARIEVSSNGIITLDPNDIDQTNTELLRTHCDWTLVAQDPTEHVSLTITLLNTLYTFCEGETNPIQIYNGESDTAPMLGSYCGTRIPPMITSEGSALHIKVELPAKFSATYSVYDSACGGTLSSLEGSFSSPGYPKRYPINIQCEWTITIPDGNHVSLNFQHFQLLESENCNTDYLEIRKNSSAGELLGVFCGDTVPSNITQLGALWILLKTSSVEKGSTIAATGFIAEYSMDHENALFGPSGSIKSPEYSSALIEGEFSWTITATFGKRILITFKQLRLDNLRSEYCFSTLTIYDGDDTDKPVLGSICGFEIPEPIKTTSNVVLIKLIMFSTTRLGNGFHLEWNEVESRSTLLPFLNQTKSCGTEEPIDLQLLKNYTSIQSPGYPYGYGPDLLCEWTFTTIPTNKLKLKFVNFNLERNFMYSSLCYADYVEVMDQIDGVWKSVAKVCAENSTDIDYINTGNVMKVVFKTNHYTNGTGFLAHITEDCGGFLMDPSGSIYYNATLTQVYLIRSYTKTCEWVIMVRSGRTVQLDFERLNLMNRDNNGCKSYLMVRNGPFSISPILGKGKYCGQESPFRLTSTSNHVYIKYDGLISAADFRINYKEIAYECGGILTLTDRSKQLEISSPNYPNIPTPHIECGWRLIGPPGEVLRIDFVDRFDLNADNQCSKEYVEVRDGGTEYSKLIDKYCEKIPPSQFSTDNMMYIKYFTEQNDPGQGFKAMISIANCGGTIRGTTGNLQSPFFKNRDKYPIGMNCTWHLIAPTGHQMRVKFVSLDLPQSKNCSSSNFVKISEIVDPIKMQTQDYGRFCGSTVPAEIQTAGNEILVEFETGTAHQRFEGFSLKFDSNTQVCGGIVKATSGTIQSPGYPNSHNNFRICRWQIVVPRGRRVTLQITDLDFDQQHRAGDLNGISFYSYISLAYIPTNMTVQSSENTLAVLYWALASSNRGFQAKFTSNEPTYCEGDFNGESGTITQPKVPLPSYYCTYLREKELVNNYTIALYMKSSTNSTYLNGRCLYNGALLQLSTENGQKLILDGCIAKSALITTPYARNKLLVLQNYKTQLNFTITYKVYRCGGVITEEEGTISSPNQTSDEIQCTWLLTLPEEQSIQLDFDSFDLGKNCEKSYLDIYNGDLPSKPKIGRFCQNHLPETIASESNSLWIVYNYDRDSNGKGFSFKYKPMIHGCGGIFHDRSMIIQTPSYPSNYPNNAECLWELRSKEGYHIGLTFNSRFQIEETANCSSDFVEIFDWKNDRYESLGKKCGRNIPKFFNSTSSRMKILFRTNEQITGTGFRAQWEWNCGGTFQVDEQERFISSPGYPVSYSNNMNCSYVFKTAKRGDYINLKFYDFNLESSTNCKFDNVTISNYLEQRYYGAKQTYCGEIKPPQIRLTNSIYISFKTDMVGTRRGFRFSYQLDSCGGAINTSSQMIKSPPFGTKRVEGLYYGYTTCSWNITAPPKKIIVVQFVQFELSARPSCYMENVDIYEGLELKSRNRLANLCGNLQNNLPDIRSKNNTMRIQMRADQSANVAGFMAAVYFVDGPDAGCGGDVQLNGTTVTTLHAPNLENMDCTWNLYSETDYAININFTQLNLPKSCTLGNKTLTGCDCGKIEIKDGLSPKSEKIQTICSDSNYENDITTSGRTASIRFIARGNPRNAFAVSITKQDSICGPTNLVVKNEVQTFISPNYPNPYPKNIHCTWILRATGQFLVHFSDFYLADTDDGTEDDDCPSGDKVKIISDGNYNDIYNGLGQHLSVVGSKRVNPQFDYFNSLIPSTHEFCGTEIKPFNFYSTSNSIAIKFFSGSYETKNRKGFKIEYQSTGCNRNYTALQGRIYKLIYSNIQFDCYNTIEVPENYTISLYFQSFLFGASFNNCESAGIEIRKGLDSSGPLLMKGCGYTLPNPIFSNINKIWIHTYAKSGRSISVNYDIGYISSDGDTGCGGTLYNYKGRFSSPQYPLSVTKHVYCLWEIRVPKGKRVALKLLVFDIQGSCEDNYLTIEGSDTKFCAGDTPAVLTAIPPLKVHYSSSYENKGRGFLAMFDAVDYV